MATENGKKMNTATRFKIYNASAGSGKTHTLAVQYIARLLASWRDTETAYRQVLAVTFTNKATAEMKDRILQQLYGVSVGLEESEGFFRSVCDTLTEMGVDMDEETVRRESGRLLRAILHDYSRFRIETIDTFFHGILVNMARELGLPAGLRTDIDQENIINEAVDRIVNRTDRDKLRGWITDFVIQNIEEGKRWNIANEVKTFSKHIFDTEYLKSQKAITDFMCDDEKVAAMRKKFDEVEEELLSALEEYRDLLIHTVDNIEDFVEFSNGKDIISHIKKINLLRNGKNTLEAPGVRLLGFANDYNRLLKAKHPVAQEEKAPVVSAALAELLKVENHARPILNSIRLTRRNINTMRLLAAVASEVNAVAYERGAFLLANTNILLDRMVGDRDTSFIYEKTGAVLRHIMLDEFQDTSVLQWNNFQTLINDNMAKGGSTLVVGDVKQSIYRWRGGRPSILSNLHKEMQRYSPQRITLKNNFRSSRHIIQFNNALYSTITQSVNQLRTSSERWDINDTYIAEDVNQREPEKCHDGGFVSIVGYTDSKSKNWKNEATLEMCHIIKDMLEHGAKPEEMVILLRNNRDFDVVAQFFNRLLPDVPLVSDEVFSLSNSVAINILINAIRVICHPQDTASIGRLLHLHNPLMSVNEIFDGMDKKQPFRSACRLLPEGFADICGLRRMPFYELIIKLSAMFGLNDMKDQSAYLMSFYDSITDSIDDNTTGLTGFLRYWDQLLQKQSVPGGEVKGISVMTIHKSKGLQWKTVFVPYCDWQIKDSNKKGNTIWCQNDSPLLCGMPLTAIDIQKDAYDSIFSEDYIREVQNQRIDNLNLLYVATTRAEENLYLWGSGKQNKNGASACPTMMQMICSIISSLPGETNTDTDAIRHTFGHLAISGEDKNSNNKKSVSTNRLNPQYSFTDIDSTFYSSTVDFRQSNDAMRFTGCTDHEAETPEQAVYINTGSVLHEIFSHIITSDDMERIINSLPPALTRCHDDRDLRDTALKLLRRGMENPVVAEWFSGRYKVFNECSIVEPHPTTHHAHTQRPDRVMIDGKDIVVVDFKFGAPKQGHIDQVEHYMALLRDIYPDCNVRGYLWYVYQYVIKAI